MWGPRRLKPCGSPDIIRGSPAAVARTWSSPAGPVSAKCVLNATSANRNKMRPRWCYPRLGRILQAPPRGPRCWAAARAGTADLHPSSWAVPLDNTPVQGEAGGLTPSGPAPQLVPSTLKGLQPLGCPGGTVSRAKQPQCPAPQRPPHPRPPHLLNLGPDTLAAPRSPLCTAVCILSPPGALADKHLGPHGLPVPRLLTHDTFSN